MNVIVQTGLGLWWSKLGKSQALVTVITLAMFFIIYLTCDCDKETAVVVVVVVVAASAAAAAVVASVVAEEIHLSKKTVILTYAAEFIVILFFSRIQVLF